MIDLVNVRDPVVAQVKECNAFLVVQVLDRPDEVVIQINFL